MSKYDDEILDDLTDEERAALEEDEQDTPTNEAENVEAADEDQEQDKGEGQEDESGGEDAGEEGAEDGEGAGDGDDAGDDAGADDDPEGEPEAKADGKHTDPAVPLLVAEAPENADARLKEIADAKADLADKFDNGDITAKEFQTQLDDLNKQERAVERAVEKAQLAAEMRRQQEVNTWLSQVREFTSVQHPEYSQSRVRWIALDEFVKEIGSKPENANLTGPEILRMAHERVVADLGEAPSKGKQGSRPLKGSKAAPPKTLAKVPAADNTELENSRWAALDRLRETDPLLHEEKLMKLTDAERDEYLSRA